MSDPIHYQRTECQNCIDLAGSHGNLIEIANLGEQPLADHFLTTPDEENPVFPLRVAVCSTCKLVQHTDIVANDLLFGPDYAFFTGASPSSIAYFRSYYEEMAVRFPKHAKGTVVEIASNDGTLLKHFQSDAKQVLGVDPATPTVDAAVADGVPTVPLLFSLDSSFKIKKALGGPADLVLANNVLAHTDQLGDFLAGVGNLLAEDGVFVCEVQYLPHLLFQTAFDHLYHEHRSFFSLTTVIDVFKKHGLVVFDVAEADTQGGSIRVYAQSRLGNQPHTERVAKLLSSERQLGLQEVGTYTSFQPRIEYLKRKLVKLLTELKAAGKTVQGYGASAKGNTLLNACGIDATLVSAIVDRTPYKIGKYAPGSLIPVVGDDAYQTPDYYLLLVWNYAAGILGREKSYREAGGRFILPIQGVVV